MLTAILQQYHHSNKTDFQPNRKNILVERKKSCTFAFENRDKFHLDLIILVRARKGRTAKKAPVRELFYFTTTISMEPVKKYINLKPFLFNSASTLRICGGVSDHTFAVICKYQYFKLLYTNPQVGGAFFR